MTKNVGAKHASPTDFDGIKKSAEKIVTALSARDGRFDRWDRMYRLEPDSMPSSDIVKDLYNPYPYNAVETVARIYSVNEPSVKVIPPEETKEAREKADTIEKFCRALLYQAQRVRGKSLVQDALRAAAIFDEFTIIVDPWIEDDADADVPFVFDIPHPRQCYPRLSTRRGLLAHVYKAKFTIAEIRDRYGEAAEGITGEDDDEVTLLDYVDKQVRCVWVEEQPEEAIIQAEHPLGFVPRHTQMCTGATFEELPENRRMSMLFPLDQAKLWYSSNLNLTLANTNVFAFLNPTWVTETEDGQGIETDLSKLGGKVNLTKGEKIYPLARQLIPPEQTQLLTQVNSMIEASTVPRVVAGEAPGGVSAAAAIGALSANGRLITKPIALAVAWGMASVLRLTLKWMEKRGGTYQVYGRESKQKLSAADLKGFDINIECELKPDMTQEMMQVLNMAQAMWQMGLGYDTIFELLESANVVRSAQDALKDMLTRAYIEENIARYATEAAIKVGVEKKAAERTPTLALPTERSVPRQPGEGIAEAAGLPPAMGVEGAAAQANPPMPSAESQIPEA